MNAAKGEMKMPGTFKSSVAVKSIGVNPQKVASNLDHDGMRALYSTIVGVAHGVSSKRSDARDPSKEYEGLGGTFEVFSPEGISVSSKVLYAPEVIHNTILAQIKDTNHPVEFAFESYVVKGGTAGFSWEYRFVLPPNSEQEFDPLAAIKERLFGATKVAAIAAPQEQRALDAPQSYGKKAKAA
jgi:hypothetical protein